MLRNQARPAARTGSVALQPLVWGSAQLGQAKGERTCNASLSLACQSLCRGMEDLANHMCRTLPALRSIHAPPRATGWGTAGPPAGAQPGSRNLKGVTRETADMSACTVPFSRSPCWGHCTRALASNCMGMDPKGLALQRSRRPHPISPSAGSPHPNSASRSTPSTCCTMPSLPAPGADSPGARPCVTSSASSASRAARRAARGSPTSSSSLASVAKCSARLGHTRG
eukprot:350521-Chlamydomonas_euryale.AAC.11